jgi:SAM-dependent methyltransferase
MNVSADEAGYHIKAGYRTNAKQATYDPSDEIGYWNEERIAAAGAYQFDVYVAVMKLVRKRACGRLLDVGCGPPYKLSMLLPSNPPEIYLVDQPNTAAVARKLLPAARFTGLNLEEADVDLGVRFDLIVCADVIEHLVDPDPCLGFIRRHIEPGGWVVISTPERDVLRGRGCTHSPHPHHVREWNFSEFHAFLESRGLRVIDHRLLPQRRIAFVRRMYGRLCKGVGHPPKWFSCQMAVCSRS